MAPWQNHEGAILVQRSHYGTLLVNLDENLHRWQQLCSGSGVEFIRKSAAHTIVATNVNFKAKEPFWYTFQLFTKNCTTMAPWLKFLKGAILVHTFEREGAILVHKSHHGTAFFGGSADFEINFWHSKRKLMSFSCLALFSSVPPQCVMLW